MGLGKTRNYADFIRKIEALPDEKLSEKVFSLNNYKGAQRVQNEFPEVFESARKATAASIMNKSVQKDGTVNINRLISEIEKIKSPEMKRMIFGDDILEKVKNIKTLYSSIPPRVGPSGTPGGLEILNRKKWTKAIDPRQWLDEIDDYISEKALNNPDWLVRMGKNIRANELKKSLYNQSPLKNTSGLLRSRVAPRALMEMQNE